MLTRLIKAFLLLLALSISTVGQQNDLIGSYLFRFEWGGERITVNPNGKFISQSSDCTSVTTSSGSYTVVNDVLRLTTKKESLRSFSDNKEHDLTKRKARKEYLDTDEPFKPYTRELQIVRWGPRVYLMDRRLLSKFIEAINLGFEPREVDGYRAYYGAIFLREGDERKPIVGTPTLPEEFLRDLLPAPVIATVVQVDKTENNAIATIDRGSDDGLRKEMSLVTVGNESFFYETHWIISVEPHTAKVQIWKDIRIGDKLTTRVPNPDRY